MSSHKPTGEEQRAEMREAWKQEYRRRKAYAESLRAAQRENRINAELHRMETALDTDDTELWARQLAEKGATAEARMEMALEERGIRPAANEAPPTPLADDRYAHLTALERFKLENGLITEAELGIAPPVVQPVEEQPKSLGVEVLPAEPVIDQTKSLGVEVPPSTEEPANDSQSGTGGQTPPPATT